MTPGRIVIFGQYKTGTTALFHKIRNSLPRSTRLLFEADSYALEKDDEKRWVLAKVIVGIPDGSRKAGNDDFMGFERKIYIIRDPRDWVISGMIFLLQQERAVFMDDRNLESVLQLLRQKEHKPEGLSTVRILGCILSLIPGRSLEGLQAWLRSHYEWLYDFEERLNGHFIMRYETFVDGDVKDLEDYLGISLPGKAEVPEEHGHVVRTKGYGDWKNWFLDEDISFFKPLLSEYLEKWGYSQEWEVSENARVSPEHCSEYVKRTVLMRRSPSGRYVESQTRSQGGAAADRR